MRGLACGLLVVLAASLVAGCTSEERNLEPEPKTEVKSPAEPPAQPGDAPPFGKPRPKIAPGQAQPVKDDAQEGMR